MSILLPERNPKPSSSVHGRNYRLNPGRRSFPPVYHESWPTGPRTHSCPVQTILKVLTRAHRHHVIRPLPTSLGTLPFLLIFEDTKLVPI